MDITGNAAMMIDQHTKIYRKETGQRGGTRWILVFEAWREGIASPVYAPEFNLDPGEYKQTGQRFTPAEYFTVA